MTNLIEDLLKEPRSLERALADLCEQYQREPGPDLARTIELLRAEIELRKRPD
jgi:hypothetical protein